MASPPLHQGTGDEGSSSSTSAANAPAVELEVVDSSAFESEQEPSGSDSAFVKGGMQAWKHAHQRVQEHERSSIHRESAEAFFLKVNKADIHTLLTDKQMTVHRDQVRKRRQVLERVIDVVKVIGKCGLSYRGLSHEATNDLENTAIDHGNFLELIPLLSKYDVCLQEHVSDCIEKKKKQYFVELVKQTLEKMDIDIKKCIGNATDGAANMQGQYKGFSALLTGASPNQVHIWCYSHVLNLVLADTTRVIVASESLFSLLNDIAVFIRDSYKRMKLWEENSEDKRHRRLGVIGETRWWAKDEALRKVFGKFAKPDNALYTDLVITMEKTEKDVTMKSVIRNKAQGYKAALLKYESILTAEIFLRIFEQTTPLSKYLQTSGMDIASAQHLVTGTEESLRKCARDFQGVMRAADDFVERASGILEKLEDSEAEVQTSLPEKRIRKHKRQLSELTQDEPMANADTDYKINIHNYSLLTDAYHIIGLGYKFLLTLSITQVACERTFSTLKLVKSRLRTSLSQDNLEAFLLMATEKEILMELDKDDIIDKMAESSELLRRLLVY
ncbi:hypothetical protein QQF64_019484 [Cirrhinus molitorella]|uniref:HAT C-terminal dimerisation domain-containing protein n=1 Tax=Cirrhinus molitorella TaxID=172907 RepID=A0ABR3LJN4_9TELE